MTPDQLEPGQYYRVLVTEHAGHGIMCYDRKWRGVYWFVCDCGESVPLSHLDLRNIEPTYQ